ncbi:MAG TPA: hypothetical protein VF021_01825 [Longimicrobiales bacterium]
MLSGPRAVQAAVLEVARQHYDARDYGSVVQLLRDLPRAGFTELPELGFIMADSARRVGGVDDVLELAIDVVAAARAAGDSRVLCDALNLQGVLLLEHGHPQAAERAWCELVVVASETDDPQYVARASNNLGISAILDMRLPDAINCLQRACAAYIRLGYARGLAQTNLNLGIVFREMDHEEESYAHFQRALTWAYAADGMDDVARIEQELALLQVYLTKDLATAAENAQMALQRFTSLGEPAGTADALKVIGVVAIANHDADEAQAALDAAIGLAREMKLLALEGETLFALAAVARLRHAYPDGYKLEQQAQAIFREMGAEGWAEQVRKRMMSLV